MPVTQRQLVETISELRKVARDLEEVADGEPLPETRGKVVPASRRGLQAFSDFLDRVAEELTELIEDKPVEVPKGLSSAPGKGPASKRS